MIVGALRCNIRVVLARHKRIEIVDRIPGAERFGISQFLAVFIHNCQVNIAGRCKRDLLALTGLDRQRVGRRIASRGNLN